MNEELKVILLDNIAKTRTCLEIIASCRNELGSLVPMEHISIVRSWVDNIEQDIQSGVIPDFQVQKLIADLTASRLPSFSKNRESILEEVRRFERSRDGGIPTFNLVRNASNHFYVYQVLKPHHLYVYQALRASFRDDRTS